MLSQAFSGQDKKMELSMEISMENQWNYQWISDI